MNPKLEVTMKYVSVMLNSTVVSPLSHTCFVLYFSFHALRQFLRFKI